MGLRKFFKGFGFGSYDGARSTRFRDDYALTISRACDEDTAVGAMDRDKLRLESRYLYRNNELASAAIHRLTAYAISKGGIRPQARSSSEDWNAEAEDFWQNYELSCDSRQRVTLKQIQEFAVIHRYIDGEFFAVLNKNGTITPIEAERIQTPNALSSTEGIVDGVKMHKSGLILGYFVCPRKNGYVDRNSYHFVSREQMIHLPACMRIDQIRGLPLMSNVINRLKDIHKTDEYTLNKLKWESMQLLKRGTAASGFQNLGSRTGRTTSDPDTTESDSQQNMVVTEWGNIWQEKKGESISLMEGKTPSGSYMPYMDWEIKTLSAGLDIPAEFLLMTYDKSYSASRASLIAAYTTIENLHDIVAQGLMQKLWNWRISLAIKEGSISPAPIDEYGRSEWYKVDWSKAAFTLIDPLKQAQAELAEICLGKSSLKAVIASSGRDRDTVLREKASDIRAAVEIANELNRDTGANITWRDIMGTQQVGAPKQDTGSDTPDKDPDPKDLEEETENES